MSARIKTILILGASRGIGEALARRFYSLGKKVIITGREQEQKKLNQLAQDLPGLEYRVVGSIDTRQQPAADKYSFLSGT